MEHRNLNMTSVQQLTQLISGDAKKAEWNPFRETEALRVWPITTPAVYEICPLFVIDQNVLKTIVAMW